MEKCETLTTSEFKALYGHFNLLWSSVHHVIVKHYSDRYKAKCYSENGNIISKITFVYDDQLRKYVRHGPYIWDGTISMYKYGVLHADDKPAIIGINYLFEAWYQDGFLHREGGPAIVHIINGHTTNSWYYRGKKFKPLLLLTKRALA